jgi:hypothetical protein
VGGKFRMGRIGARTRPCVRADQDLRFDDGV